MRKRQAGCQIPCHFARTPTGLRRAPSAGFSWLAGWWPDRPR